MDPLQFKVIELIKSIAEHIILRLPPYDRISLSEPISRSLMLYQANHNKLDDELSEGYLPSLVVLAKARIDSYFCMLDGSVPEGHVPEGQVWILTGDV